MRTCFIKKIFSRKNKLDDLESKLPAICGYVIDNRTEEICRAIMQQIGDEWICTRDNKHRYPMNYSNSNFFPALCAYIINDDTGEICGEVMQQLGDDYVCTKNNNHRYKTKN